MVHTDPAERRAIELEVRELAAGTSWKRRKWVATLADEEERAEACRWMAVELAGKK